MAMRDLLGSECGRNNPLVQITSHFLLDPTHEELGLSHSNSSTHTDEMVQEYLEGIYGSKTQSFCMDTLLQEMHNIESENQIPSERELPKANDSTLPTIDSVWMQEYMESKPFYEEYHEEQLWNATPYKSDLPLVEDTCHPGYSSLWPREYFKYDEQNIDTDENWLQDDEGDEGKRSLLQDLAKQFLNSVDDPKLKCSKFMKFMQQIGNGDVSVSGGQVVEHLEPGLNAAATIKGTEICSASIVSPFTALESIP